MVDPTFRLGPLAETLFCPRDRRVDRVGCWYAEAPVASAKTTAAVETFIVKFQTVKFGILQRGEKLQCYDSSHKHNRSAMGDDYPRRILVRAEKQ